MERQERGGWRWWYKGVGFSLGCLPKSIENASVLRENARKAKP
jgi:hypothetical protein